MAYSRQRAGGKGSSNHTACCCGGVVSTRSVYAAENWNSVEAGRANAGQQQWPAGKTVCDIYAFTVIAYRSCN